ncbi:MAG: serpin family protein [Myxococcales bacterium]|nr:serpin family protein [Myxococcales bacterium]
MRRLIASAALALSLSACPSPDAVPISDVPPPTPSEGPSDSPGETSSPETPAPAPTPSVPEVDNTTTTTFQDATGRGLDALVASTNAFSFDLLGRLPSKGNVAASPASVAIALGMTYAGAAGTTAVQMHDTLQLTLPGKETHDAFGTLLRKLAPPAKAPYELAIANRLFGEKSIDFQTPFLSVTKSHYQAPLEPVDFKNGADAARRHINGWVESQTKNRIKDLLPEGSLVPDTRLVLANAIYFKGKWQLPFDEKVTKPGDFHRDDNEVVEVPLMHKKAQFGYTREELAGSALQVLELPYVGRELSMVVVLPEKRDGMHHLQGLVTSGKLDAKVFEGWTKKLFFQEVDVTFPRFKIDPPKGIELEPTLSAMGMPRAFTDAAEFPHMAVLPPGEGLKISEVFHKAFVEVNEEGTEAAAATGVVMMRTTALQQPRPPQIFVADHPFLFFIRDRRTGAILFVGRVSEP